MNDSRGMVATNSRFAFRMLTLSIAFGACCLAFAGCSKKLAPTQPESRSRTATTLALSSAGVAPSPGLVAGGFCTYPKGFLGNNLEVARHLNQYFATGAVGSEIFHVGDAAAHAYTWQKTGTTVTIRQGNKSVQVDGGVQALQQAVGTGGRPGEFSISAINPNDMGTGGILGAQELALKVNQAFSESFVSPATGFSGLSLVGMNGVRLGGTTLTAAQANALNGQATLQVRDAADEALGLGTLPYGLSFGQLTDLLDLLNGSFESCGPSTFARDHLYQPYVTSNAFSGKRPATVSDFATKPTYNTFQGQVVFVGDGCSSAAYASFPAHAIALIERGGCTFYQKVSAASAAGASAAIIFNSAETAGCPATPTPGSNRCEALVGLGAAAGSPVLPIPVAFVQRSTGLLLKDASGPVTVFVQQ